MVILYYGLKLEVQGGLYLLTPTAVSGAVAKGKGLA